MMGLQVQLKKLGNPLLRLQMQEFSALDHVPDIDECKEGLACQCEGCSCKNTWGGYGCKCKGNKLYIMEKDTCIGWNILMKFCVLPVFQDICTCEWCIQSQFVFTLYRFSDHQFARVFLKYSLTWTRSLWLLCHNTCPCF